MTCKIFVVLDRPDSTTKKTIYSSTPKKLTETTENFRETAVVQKVTNTANVATTQAFAFDATVAEIEVKPSLISTAPSKAAHLVRTTTGNVSSKIVSSPPIKATFKPTSNYILSPLAVDKIIEPITTKENNMHDEMEPFMLPVSTTHLLETNQPTTYSNKLRDIESTIFPKVATNKIEQHVFPAKILSTNPVSRTATKIFTTFKENKKLVPTTTMKQKFVEQTPKWQETRTIKETDEKKISTAINLPPSTERLFDTTQAISNVPTPQNVKHTTLQSNLLTASSPKKYTLQHTKHTSSSSTNVQVNQTASFSNITNTVQIITKSLTTSTKPDNSKNFTEAPSTSSITDKNFNTTKHLKSNVTDHNLLPISLAPLNRESTTDIYKTEERVATTKISSTATSFKNVSLTPEANLKTSTYYLSSSLTPFGSLLQTKETITGIPEMNKMLYLSTEYQAAGTSTIKQMSEKLTAESLENQTYSSLLNSVHGNSTADATTNVVSTFNPKVNHSLKTTIFDLDASATSNQNRINAETSSQFVLGTSTNVANSILHLTATKQNANEKKTEKLQYASRPSNELTSEPLISVFEIDSEHLTSSVVQSSTGSVIYAKKTSKPIEYGSSSQHNPTTLSVLQSKAMPSKTINKKPTEHITVSQNLNHLISSVTTTEKIRTPMTSNSATVFGKLLEQNAKKPASITTSQSQHQPTTSNIESITRKTVQRTSELIKTSTATAIIAKTAVIEPLTTTAAATARRKTTPTSSITTPPTSLSTTTAPKPMLSKLIQQSTATSAPATTQTVTSATTVAMPATTRTTTEQTSIINATEGIVLEPEDQDLIDFDPNSVPLVEVNILPTTVQTDIKNFLNATDITPGRQHVYCFASYKVNLR